MGSFSSLANGIAIGFPQSSGGLMPGVPLSPHQIIQVIKMLGCLTHNKEGGFNRGFKVERKGGKGAGNRDLPSPLC